MTGARAGILEDGTENDNRAAATGHDNIKFLTHT
jgi:hypothetical protein